MDKYLGVKYKLKSSDNFENYLKFIDIGLLSRKTALAVSPVSVLTRDDDGVYIFKMSTSFRTVTITFKLNEEFIEERADGVKVKSTMIVDGDNLIQTQVEDNGRKSTHVRHYTPDTLTVVSVKPWIYYGLVEYDVQEAVHLSSTRHQNVLAAQLYRIPQQLKVGKGNVFGFMKECNNFDSIMLEEKCDNRKLLHVFTESEYYL